MPFQDSSFKITLHPLYIPLNFHMPSYQLKYYSLIGFEIPEKIPLNSLPFLIKTYGKLQESTDPLLLLPSIQAKTPKEISEYMNFLSNYAESENILYYKGKLEETRMNFPLAYKFFTDGVSKNEQYSMIMMIKLLIETPISSKFSVKFNIFPQIYIIFIISFRSSQIIKKQ